MKYLIMIYTNPLMRDLWGSFSDAQRDAGWAFHAAFRESLIAAGELVHSEALVDPSQAKQVHVRDGQTIASDGPFAEAKEQLAGFYVVECDSMERAVELGSKLPEAGFGMVEVRAALNMRGVDM